MSPDWSCGGDSFEIRNEWLGLRDGVFDLRQGQRSVVACGAIPDFGDPEDVFIRRVLGDKVAEATWHVRSTLFEDANHLLALARDNGHFHDESVHFVCSLQF